MVLCIHTDSSNISQLIQAIGIIVAIFVFIGNLWWQNHTRDRDILERLNNEIFVSCEKIMRTAYRANSCLLAARYHYALYLIGENKSHNERFYFKFYDESQAANSEVKIHQIDLVKNIEDYKRYGSQEKYNKIVRLVSMDTLHYVNYWVSIFDNAKTKEAIDEVYREQSNTINFFLNNLSIGKNMRAIQKIVHPNYPIEILRDMDNSEDKKK